MELTNLQARAVEIADQYDRHNVAAGRTAWTTADLALGFAGDVGDLTAEFARMTDDLERKLG